MTGLTRSCLLAICAIATTSLAAVPPLDAAAPGRRTTQTTAAPPAIAVGYCAPLAELAQAKAAGFDYVELRTTEFAGMTDAAFDEAVARAARIGLPTPVSNLFLPGTLKVTGPDVDPAAQVAYVTRAFERARRLGITTVVFGSSGARNVPDGFPAAEAFQQLVAFGRRIAPIARANGITVAVEPLRRQESNIINTAREGLALVEAIDDPNFQLMIDFYHLASEHEDPRIVIDAGDHLRHLHMANPSGRVFPLQRDEFAYEAFFATLRQAGYARRISIEASSPDVGRDGPVAIALLRELFVK